MRTRMGLIVTTAVCFVWMVPLIHLVSVSSQRGLSDYRTVIRSEGLLRNVLNSMIISAGTIALVIAVASPAAFAFSKLRFPGRMPLFVLILAGLFLPTAAILVPLTQTVRTLDWANTYQSLIVPYAALAFPFALLLLKHAYDGLPDELFEAAVLDGASHWSVYRLVLAPLTRATRVMVIIWTFLGAWNELLLAILFMHAPEKQPITVVPLTFVNRFFADVPKIFAALVVIELPVVFLYVLFQRRFERGLVEGAVK